MSKIIIDNSNFSEHSNILEGIIGTELEHFNRLYPEFEKWYSEKVIKGLVMGERIIQVSLKDGKPSGYIILKNTKEEKKLCTLRVKEEFNNSGLGVKLFIDAFEILETETPLLSVSDVMLNKYDRIFDYFGFEKVEEYSGLYLPKNTEISYNGELK